MTSELFSIVACNSSGTNYVSSSVTAWSGALYLTSTLWGETTSGDGANYTSFRVPKGCAFKVWESKLVSNVPATVHVQVCNMTGTMSGQYQTLATDTVVTSGSEVRTSRSGRPLVVESHNGDKNIKFFYNHTSSHAVLIGSYNVEVVELGEQ
jgi:hypothetical protein